MKRFEASRRGEFFRFENADLCRILLKPQVANRDLDPLGIRRFGGEEHQHAIGIARNQLRNILEANDGRSE